MKKEILWRAARFILKQKTLGQVLCLDVSIFIFAFLVEVLATIKKPENAPVAVYYGMLFLGPLIFTIILCFLFRPDWFPDKKIPRFCFLLSTYFVTVTPVIGIRPNILVAGKETAPGFISFLNEQTAAWAVYVATAIVVLLFFSIQLLLAVGTERDRLVENINTDATVQRVLDTAEMVSRLHTIYTVKVPKEYDSAALDRLIDIGVLRLERGKAGKAHPEREYSFYNIYKQHLEKLKHSPSESGLTPKKIVVFEQKGISLSDK